MERGKEVQLIINPGSTSTKLALFQGEEKMIQEDVVHRTEELAVCETIPDQLPLRMEALQGFLQKHLKKIKNLDAVMGRGGLVPGLQNGGYVVDKALCHALESSEISSPHASNLGGMMAAKVGEAYGIPAYIYDAVTASSLSPVASLTGIKDIRRQSFCHVLNSRAMAIEYAKKQGLNYQDLRLLVAHLGGGISVSVHEHGAIIDTIGDDEGQFSPERSGSVPALELIKLCYSGKYTASEMKKKIRGMGGMYAHLGTSDAREIEKRILEGDAYAEQVFKAQAYQIAKGIGQLSIVLKGKCDAIILTGGLAYSKILTKQVEEYVGFLAPVIVMPGEKEMEALALGGLRILRGEETTHVYLCS